MLNCPSINPISAIVKKKFTTAFESASGS